MATAALIAYFEARRTSKRKDTFGKGEPDGMVACQSANTAAAGSALLPGITGDPVTAVTLCGPLLRKAFAKRR